MAAVWSDEARFGHWLEIEILAVEAWARLGTVPADDARAIRERAAITVERVNELEQVTRHDVAAFVQAVGESVGDAGRWIHFGMTSSDVLDTGLALQLREAGTQISAGAAAVTRALAVRAREFRDTICAGRTHGVHAEPTTFGLKLAGFAFESARNAGRLRRAFDQVAVGKLSGAVGTYSTLEPSVEAAVMERLRLGHEPLSTQVVPRDRHAELMGAIAL